MSSITFTNGSRIFTPQQPARSAGQMVPGIEDINGDGIVDILDYATVLAYTLVDYNADGVINMLDALQYNVRNPGGIPIWIPETASNPPKTFDLEKCCDENYPDDHWGFSSNNSNRQNTKKCVEFKDQITKISTCLPCNSTPLEEAVCKACATIPPDGRFFGSRLVEIYSAGTEPTNPGVKLGKGKATVTQDGVTYVVWCSQIMFRQCVECFPDPNNPSCCSIDGGACECGLGPFGDPSWHAIGTNYCTGFTEEECLYYWFRLDYPYPTLSSPETFNGPRIGTFIWSPADQADMCKCADLTQDYDPCRYGGTIQQCIEENGGSIDPGPSV